MHHIVVSEKGYNYQKRYDLGDAYFDMTVSEDMVKINRVNYDVHMKTNESLFNYDLDGKITKVEGSVYTLQFESEIDWGAASSEPPSNTFNVTMKNIEGTLYTTTVVENSIRIFEYFLILE